jgi:hypothetical protein
MCVLRVFKVCELMGLMFAFGLMLAYAQLTTNSLLGRRIAMAKSYHRLQTSEICTETYQYLI